MFQFPDKMLRVFRDEKHQNDFEKNGLFKLDDYSSSIKNIIVVWLLSNSKKYYDYNILTMYVGNIPLNSFDNEFNSI